MTDTKPVEPGKEYEGPYLYLNGCFVDIGGRKIHPEAVCAMLNAKPAPASLPVEGLQKLADVYVAWCRCHSEITGEFAEANIKVRKTLTELGVEID